MLNKLDFSLQDVNVAQPTFWTVTYVILMAFVLSSCIALVYHLTSARKGSLGQFIQTLILGSIGASIIVLAIGDSVGRGLGILGALAIIRFRTTLRQQRDIVFVFCALGVGMACGMYGFNIAVVGTIVLCILALIFRFTPLHGLPQTKTQLRITIPSAVSIGRIEIESILKKKPINGRLIRNEWIDDLKSSHWELTYEIDKVDDVKSIIQSIKGLDDQIRLRLWSRPENEND